MEAFLHLKELYDVVLPADLLLESGKIWVFINTSQFRQNQNPSHFIKSQWNFYKILLAEKLRTHYS